MARLVSFTGRLLFAFLFLSSGLQKLTHFDIVTGGPEMYIVEPKIDVFISNFERFIGVQVPLYKTSYPYLLLIAIVLELVGGVLFTLGSKFGAFLLLLFLVAVTPVMHAFWDLPPDTAEHLNDMINFFKNTALAGSLLFYIDSY